MTLRTTEKAAEAVQPHPGKEQTLRYQLMCAELLKNECAAAGASLGFALAGGNVCGSHGLFAASPGSHSDSEMGVPSYFRWLSTKYPRIVVDAVDEQPPEVDGVVGTVNTANANPNGIEYDNLYLDMNGIIHPCSHPESKEQPKNDAEIMDAIFKYIDRLFSIVRPRRLLYMAIDGVAPRAKMNQQRSRRFRSAREAKQKRDIEEGIQKDLLDMGRITEDQYNSVLADKPHFDSNCITPGTEFMDLVAKGLQYYAVDRLTRDPGWRGVQVILSDASVPGEGEHKIMEIIRFQRQLPTYDPNTHHVIYGLDADLIMLGLATHEPHFSILREYVSLDGKRTTVAAAMGQAPAEASTQPEPQKQAPFQFLRINVLREYLSADLHVDRLPFKWDLERALDDYVFLCFFVGNDFLPHLPTLEIREGAIDLLIELWKRSLPKMGGFVTEDGEVDFSRAEIILSELGELENEILARRRQRDLRSRQRQLEQAARDRRLEAEALLERQEQSTGLEPSSTLTADPLAISEANKVAASLLKQQLLESAEPEPAAVPQDHKRERPDDEDVVLPAAKKQKLKEVTETMNPAAPDTPMEVMVSPSNESAEPINPVAPHIPMEVTDTPPMQPSNVPTEKVKKQTILIEEADVKVPFAPVEEDPDEVRLGEEGWKERYYSSKFGAKLDSPEDAPFFRRLVSAYVHGLQWVLRYYYQGCCSWTWYYPFHYAPFAGELKTLHELTISFDKGTPFKPFEQLMGVLPAASGGCLPEPYRTLMSEPDSPIIDFYPVDFEIDLNGKRFEWQGVALLPFIDQDRLLAAIRPIENALSDPERHRNSIGRDIYFVRFDHPAAHAISELVELSGQSQNLANESLRIPIDPTKSSSFAGQLSVWTGHSLVVGAQYRPEFKSSSQIDPLAHFPAVENKALVALYHLPELPPGTRFRSGLLRNVTMPRAELTSWDLARRRSNQHFGQNTPASRILDHVMNANRGGRGGGRGGSFRGGRGGNQDNRRGEPYANNRGFSGDNRPPNPDSDRSRYSGADSHGMNRERRYDHSSNDARGYRGPNDSYGDGNHRDAPNRFDRERGQDRYSNTYGSDRRDRHDNQRYRGDSSYNGDYRGDYRNDNLRNDYRNDYRTDYRNDYRNDNYRNDNRNSDYRADSYSNYRDHNESYSSRGGRGRGGYPYSGPNPAVPQQWPVAPVAAIHQNQLSQLPPAIAAALLLHQQNPSGNMPPSFRPQYHQGPQFPPQ